MRGFLLDTNIVSELRRTRPQPRVLGFVAAQSEDLLHLSEVSFAEIRFGIEQLADADRRAVLTTWLAQTLRPLFAGRTLGVTEDVILRWRLMVEAGRRRRHTFGQPDLFIAAIAAVADLVVVSRDATHFVAAAVAHLDPWSGVYTSASGQVHTVETLADPALLSRLKHLT